MLSDEEKKAVEENIAMCYHFARKEEMQNMYLRKMGIGFDDLLSIAFESLCKTVQVYDPAKGFTLSTLFSVITKHAVAMEARKWKSKKRNPGKDVLSLNAPLNDLETIKLEDVVPDEKNGVADHIHYCELVGELKGAIQMLPTIERKIVSTVCLRGVKQEKCAKMLGVTQTCVSKRLKSARTKIAGCLNRAGYQEAV